ncbi:ATP-binding protein [Actinacidiphila guanduensis]|uniref:histidine kinase n=1 Tax=Actinacidiphila guanduensis TaxID=310781 RepID=A0A1H0KBH9_9ACTN|nr:ATP-binding protein [Actinacidiphila guanduensis]SDO53203.1 two-component system, OmpR family, sensor histidine kinase KdpD [Actinacidiphila guanduensis]
MSDPTAEPPGRPAQRTRRGRLKVYLGAAPGVGKTYRMLDEGHRRVARGTDVVVAFAECHHREHTLAKLDGLEVVPRLEREYRGTTFRELDVAAVLARNPRIALVDELAHTNPPGGRNAKRWQDVEDLLDAGIDVVTTLNVQHLESVNDVVEKITEVPQRETVPDEVVRRADQIELVDMPAEALRRRLAHGNVYAAEKVDAALANYFRIGNLTALRELALLWVAGRVDEALHRYRSEHGIGRVWETKERVVVALTGGPEGDTLIRRAARIADRSAGGDLLAVHVARSDGLAVGASPAALARQRQLVESLGGSYHSVVGDDVSAALLEFARAAGATQLVLGTSSRRRWERLLTGRGIGETTVGSSADIDVHMVTHERAGHGRLLPSRRRTLTTWRLLAGPVSGLVLPVALTALLAGSRGTLNLTSEALLFLFAVVCVACLGGVVSAVVASVTASLLLNYYFIPPVGQFTIAEPNNILALAVFAIVAGTVAAVVDRSLRLSRRAARATAEAETLSSLAASIVRGGDAVPALLEQARETFAMDSAELVRTAPEPEAESAMPPTGPVERTVGTAPAEDGAARPFSGPDGTSWRQPWPLPDPRPHSGPDGAARQHAGAYGTSRQHPAPDPGSRPGSGPDGAARQHAGADAGLPVVRVPAGDGTALVLRGRELSASDQRVLAAFAAHVSAAAERDRLARAAAEVEPVKAADRMRTALLAAVSHDLRTPLAVGWAAVSSLRSHDVDFSAEDREELLATAEESLARLSRLVENLLDMSRLQAGALRLDLRPTALEEVLPAALEALPSDAPGIDAHGLEEAPAVAADPPLLERVIANLLANAARHAPRDRPVVLTASALGDRVELRVVDRGPGLPASDRERAFEPFQRMGDNDNTTGLGLGLALARGLTEAMGGTLTPEDTPGGGLTMVLSLPAATTCPVPPPDPAPAPTGPGTPPADPAADDLADDRTRTP